MSISKIQLHLEGALQYLQAHVKLTTCHMVNYLRENHWENLVPAQIRGEIRNETDEERGIDLFFSPTEELRTLYPMLNRFLIETRNYYLENLSEVVCSRDTLESAFCRGRLETRDIVSVKEFMSEKKNHEVETLAHTIAGIIDTPLANTVIVDAGDGKGYLSSRLALAYNFKVLGVDANTENTKNAQERSIKLKKAWNGLATRAELIKAGITPPKRGKQKPSPRSSFGASICYKTVSKFISEETNFLELVRNNIELPNSNIYLCLTGLHTCGNLASTCLKIFSSRNEMNLLCNVGCCYHLLDEQFATEEKYVNTEIKSKNHTIGFPLSKFLKERKTKIGRNARMIASQSVPRAQSNRELPNQALFFRSLLEVLINENVSNLEESVQVGKIKNYENFIEYVHKCEKKIKLGLDDISPEYIEDLLLKYREEAIRINLFYFIRMSLAPIVETVILLDRLLFLKEQGIDNSFLVRLFDPVISPRCYGIFALKDQKT